MKQTNTGDFPEIPEYKIKKVEDVACKECDTNSCVKKGTSNRRSLKCILYSVNWETSQHGKLEKHFGL